MYIKWSILLILCDVLFQHSLIFPFYGDLLLLTYWYASFTWSINRRFFNYVLFSLCIPQHLHKVLQLQRTSHISRQFKKYNYDKVPGCRTLETNNFFDVTQQILRWKKNYVTNKLLKSSGALTQKKNMYPCEYNFFSFITNYFWTRTTQTNAFEKWEKSAFDVKWKVIVQ